ncbi:MAG: DUF4261 domain-containing protein [Thermogutta sp.]|nr:DUF4261 domain-containing protein [Thermogutta sp.]
MKSRVALALVALREPKLPTADQFEDYLGEHWPDAPEIRPAEEVPTPDGEQAEGIEVFRFGDGLAAVSLMNSPIPFEDLEFPCWAAWYWPTAEQEMRTHNSHLLVALVDGPDDPIERHRHLTQLVASAAGLTDAVGIFWGSGGSVHETQAFLDSARQMSAEVLPLELWVAVRFAPEDDDSVSCITDGLEEFGLNEIEVVSSRREPQTLLEYLYNVAYYLIENGPVIHDGETIGLTEDERFLVTFGESRLTDRPRVMRIEL